MIGAGTIRRAERRLGLVATMVETCGKCGGVAPRGTEKSKKRHRKALDGDLEACVKCGLPVELEGVFVTRTASGPRVHVRVVDLRPEA